MNCESSSRKLKVCCRGKRVCSCDKECIIEQDNNGNSSSKQYQSGGRPWIPSWFDNGADRHHASIDKSTTICNHKRLEEKMDVYRGGKFVFPTQACRQDYIPNDPILPSFTIIGHPSLRIYKFRLPNHLLHLLDHIVDGCADHASTLTTGWMTYLYSLTKQDIALRDVPGLYEASKPIIHHIKRTIEK